MWTMAKHADSMKFDGNLMVVLMTECRTLWRDPRSNRGSQSRPSSPKDLFQLPKVSRAKHGSAGGACSMPLAASGSQTV